MPGRSISSRLENLFQISTPYRFCRVFPATAPFFDVNERFFHTSRHDSTPFPSVKQTFMCRIQGNRIRECVVFYDFWIMKLLSVNNMSVVRFF